VHKKTRLQAAPGAHHIPREGTIPIIDMNTHPRPRDPKAPPSPSTLAHRLAALSPRHSNASPLSGSLPEPDPEEDIPGTTDDDTESPLSLLDDENTWEWGHPQRNQKVPERTPSSTVATEAANSSSHQGINQDDGSHALEDAVRGLYWLWKTRRGSDSSPGGKGETSTEELDRTDFLRLVDRAIAAKI
jgi:hypothetical protein